MTSSEDLLRQYRFSIEALQKENEKLIQKLEFVQAQLDVVREFNPIINN